MVPAPGRYAYNRVRLTRIFRNCILYCDAMMQDCGSAVIFKDLLMKKWMCVFCGFIYDESLGLPEENIPPGTKWADIPEDFRCPDCGFGKSDFEMFEL